MPEIPAAPTLEETLARLLSRERARRRDAALARTFASTALAALVVAAWRIFDRVMGTEPLPVAWAAAAVAGTFVVGLAAAVRAATSRSERDMAREIDRRLALSDRASAALTIVRGGATSRLAAFVVGDAESALRAAAPRVDAAFPSKPTRRVTKLTRLFTKTALVAAALAVLAELLAVDGPLHWLPGFALRGGGEKSAAVPPTKDAPHADRAPAKAPENKSEKPEAKTPDASPNADEAKKPPAPSGEIQVALKPAKEEYAADEPIAAAVSATARGEIARARVFDVRVSVDGVDVDAGYEMRVDPARPEGDHVDLDLRRVPGLRIEPGEHVARARLTTRTTHEEHESPPAKFRVLDAPKKHDDQKKDDGAGAPRPKPEPQPAKPPPTSGDPSKKDARTPAGAPPPPPPAALDKKVVVPLFGEGEEVKKRGVVLVLDPGGGIEAPPKVRPLEEALPDARRRAESAVDRAGVRDEDRDLVRRYFELLEKLGR